MAVNVLAKTNLDAADAVLAKNAGAEMKAMMDKSREGKDLDDNFGHKKSDKEKREVAKQVVTPSTGISKTKKSPSDGDDVASSEKKPTQVVSGNQAVENKKPFDPNSGINQKIENKEKDKNDPKWVAKEEVQRRASLNNGTPERESFFQQSGKAGDAADNVAGPVKKMLNEQAEVRRDENGREKEGGDLPVEQKGETKISDEKINDDYFDNLNQQFPDLNMTEGKFNSLKKALKNAGFDMPPEEVMHLLQCNFKVKFPWGPIIMNISKGLTEITGLLISLFFTIVGLRANALPVLGTIAGFAVSTVGMIIGIGVMVTGFVIVLIGIYLKYRYMHNASDAIQKVGFIRRLVYREFIKQVLKLFFSGIIPLVGWVLNIILNIMTWMRLKKIIGRLEKIVKGV